MSDSEKIQRKNRFTVRSAGVVTKEKKDDGLGVDVFLTLDIESDSGCFEITVQADQFVLAHLQDDLESLAWGKGITLFPSPSTPE